MSTVIGARVKEQAGPGEVFATSTVRDLVFGSGLVFEDRGRRQLKGVPGDWQVFAAEDERAALALSAVP
jgi:class 3 adenylate cyclase